MLRAKNHRHDYPMILRINERRHGKLQKTSSCLQRGNSEILTAGIVSALKYQHAYNLLLTSGIPEV